MSSSRPHFLDGLAEYTTRRPLLTLTAAALAGSIVTAGAIGAGRRLTRKRRRKHLADSLSAGDWGEESRLPTPSNADAHLDLGQDQEAHDARRAADKLIRASNSAARDFDPDLIREQLSRNYSFLGDEGMARIRDSFVVVVGAGGVGSWAALMLLRSGVSRLRLIDFDQVTLSSLNRHAVATLGDVGRPKVTVCQRHFADIAPWAEVEARIEMYSPDNARQLLSGEPTWVIDAIDNINTKVDLLKYCYENGIKVFSSMGAGAKSDPSRIQISDISTTFEDPLARSVRRQLRALNIPPLPPKNTPTGTGRNTPAGVDDALDADSAAAAAPVGIPCVYSTEKSDTRLLPLDEEEFQKGKVAELSAVENFRVRILPVLGPLPAMFGLAAATHVLCAIAEYPQEPLAIKGRRKVLEKVLMDTSSVERRVFQAANIPFSVEDLNYIYSEIFRGRSVHPPFASVSKPYILRWDPRRPLAYDNLVLFDKGNAARHEKEVLVPRRKPDEVWGDEVVQEVEKRMEEERRLRVWR